MIIFRWIKWQNLLSTGNTPIEFRLDTNPTCLIVGKNGAGKSTLLDALCYVLFDRPFRKYSKTKLINSINKKNTLVEISFSIGQKEYLIRRGMKPGIFEIWVDGSMIDQDAKKSDYQKFLEQTILKMSFKTFTQVAILGSARFTPFMELSAPDRRQVIEDVLDIQIFSVMQQVLKSKRDQVRRTLTDMQHKLDIAESKIDMQKRHISSIKSDRQEMVDQLQADIEDNQQQIDKLTASNDQLESQMDSLLDQIPDHKKVEKNLSEMESYLRTYQRKRESAQSDIDKFDDLEQCPTCKQDLGQQFRTSVLEEQKSKVDKFTTAIEAAEQQLSKLKERYQEITKVNEQYYQLQRRYQDNANAINSTQQYINKLRAQIDDANTKTGNVDEQQEVLDKMIAATDAAKNKVETLEDQMKTYDMAAVLLKDTGIKTAVIKKYLPLMNQWINKYLDLMDFHVSFHLDESFNETIKSRYRDAFVFESFSEGEKSRINQALLLAWREVARMKNSASTNLLILDEVFDGSLDDEGSEYFMRILNELSSNGCNIIVISHKGENLLDSFHKTVKVEKVKDFARYNFDE